MHLFVNDKKLPFGLNLPLPLIGESFHSRRTKRENNDTNSVQHVHRKR